MSTWSIKTGDQHLPKTMATTPGEGGVMTTSRKEPGGGGEAMRHPL